MIYIYPYKLGSASAKALRDGLSPHLGYRVKLVKPNGRFNPRRTDRVINWGMSTLPNWEMDMRDLNQCKAILKASDKRATFKLLTDAGVTTPEWTFSIETARSWNTTVLCRTIINGHSGAGIVMADKPDDIVPAPLYVKYKKKKEEYRIHVYNGKVIDTQIKRKRDGFKENTNFSSKIRNHHTGWVYCRTNIVECGLRDNLAVQAVKALGLDFGAVDMIYNEREDKYYVLEINTAPGLDGTTIDKYVEAIVK